MKTLVLFLAIFFAGCVTPEPKTTVRYYDAKGQYIGKSVDGRFYDSSGRYVGKGITSK